MKERALKNKRIILTSAAMIVLIIIVTFFKVQMDDERYYMMYDFEDVKEEVYDARGILHADDSLLSPGDLICSIPAVHIASGSYSIEIDHQQDTDSRVEILEGNELLASFVLPASELETVYAFSSDHDLYHLTIRFLYDGGTVDIKHVFLRASGLFYTDTIVCCILMVIILVFAALFAVRKDFMGMPHRERLFYLAFPAVFVFLNYPFFREFWIPQTADDFLFWVARIEQTKNELLRGQFPVWMLGAELEGHGVINILYPGLFSFVPALLRICRVSMEAAVRYTFMLLNAVGMFTSYYAVKRISNDRRAAFLGMILYMMIPYRLSLYYFRVAYGEAAAVVFLPLVILGIYEIFVGDRKRWLVLALGLTGILQSHVLSMVMTAGFCIAVGLLMIPCLFRDRRILSLLKSLTAFFLLNLWYIIPFVEAKGYDLKLAEMFSVMDFSSVSYYPSEWFAFFSSTASVSEHYRTPMLGPALWLMVCMLFYYCLFRGNKDKKHGFLTVIFAVSLLFLFMQSRWFPWQTLQKFDMIRNFVSMIQFPIRFGQISGAGLAIAGAVVAAESELYKRHMSKILAFCLISSCALMLLISDSWTRTLETGETGDLKFMPDIGVSDYEDYALRDYDGTKYPDVPESDAAISDYMRAGIRAEFDYESDTDTAALLPIQAYPGYRAYGPDGKLLETSVGEYAMLKVKLPAASGKSHVTVVYEQPVIWRISLVISLVSWIICLSFVIAERRRAAVPGL